MTETTNNIVDLRSPGLASGQSVGEITSQLERILATPEFTNSAQLSDFLRYVVERHITGDTTRLKGYTIAVEALGRSKEFDPRTDAIVRVVATRVRKALDYYYMAFGQSDPLIITIPRGSYAPKIALASDVESESAAESAPVLRADLKAEKTPELMYAKVHTFVSDDAQPPPPLPVSIGEAEPSSPPVQPTTDVSEPQAALVKPLVIGWRHAAIAAVMVTAALIGGWMWQQTHSEPIIGLPPTGPRIAVIPFANASRDKSLDVFAYGLSFELVSALARVHTLSVYADTESTIGTDNTVFGTLPQKIQDVDYVLQGLLRRTDESVAIDHILLDTDTAKVVWTKSEQVSLITEDVLDVQRRVVQAVVGGLSGGGDGVILDLEIARTTDHSGVSFDAYRCVLSVHDYWKSFSAEHHLHSRDCLEQTVELFPDYSLAYTRLSALYLDEYKYRLNVRSEYDPLERSTATVYKAMELDSDSLQARNTLFNIEMARGNTENALEIGRALINDNPNDAVFLANFGSKLAYGLGQWDEGMVYANRALAIVPTAPAWYFIAPAWNAVEHGNYDQALKLVDQMRGNLTASALIAAVVHGQRQDRLKTQDSLKELAKRDINDLPTLEKRMARWSMSPDLKKKVLVYMHESYQLVTDS